MFVRDSTRMLPTIFLLALLVVATMSPLFPIASAESREIKRSREADRITASNDAITLVVVAGGKHPDFLWYANRDSSQLYRVKFKGIVEFLDLGQKIFQRKFQADLQEQIQRATTEIKAVDAGKAGSKLVVVGAIRENRDRATLPVFNYTISKAGEEIGVKITRETKLTGQLRGEVIVRGIVEASGRIIYIRALNVAPFSEVQRELRDRPHPPFFEFNQGRWDFTGFQEIKSGAKVIGFQFGFTMKEIRSPKFKSLEDQIVIRSRIYNATVREGGLTVTSASLKTDFIIKSWDWNVNSTAAGFLGLDLANDKLALWVELTSFKADKVEDAIEERSKPAMTHAKSEDERIDARPRGEARGDEEKELKVMRDEHKLNFVQEDKVLGGFFNFTNFAFAYPRGASPARGEKLPVSASYLSDDHKLRLFLIYPHFGSKTLEHDPTIGVEIEGITKTPEFDLVEATSAVPVSPLAGVTTATVTVTAVRTETITRTQTVPVTTTQLSTVTVTTTLPRPSPEPADASTAILTVALPLIIVIAALAILLVRRRRT